MRDRGSSAPGYSIIDSFSFVVNSTSEGAGPVLLFGEAGLATILLGQQLRCLDLSVCDKKPSTTCATQSEFLKEHEDITVTISRVAGIPYIVENYCC